MYRNSENKISPLNDTQDSDFSTKICFRVVDHVDAMLAYWDNKEICRFANHSYLKLFGNTQGKLVGKITMKELFGKHYAEIKPHIKKVLEGKKQVFEFQLDLHGDDPHHYIVTYNPDKIKGKVEGFFAQMADINLVKKLDTKLLDFEKAKRREILRSVIETQETERELIAYELRDKVNQTLAFSKMMLQSEGSKKNGNVLLTKISDNLHETIDELNRISTDLTPSVITMIGFIAGVKEYLNNFERRYHLKVTFNCMYERIEQLAVNDKISIFRIVQNYLLILSRNTGCKNASIDIRSLNSKLILRMRNNNLKFELPSQSKEFLDIEHRLEYYDGTWRHFIEKNKKTLLIELEIPS